MFAAGTVLLTLAAHEFFSPKVGRREIPLGNGLETSPRDLRERSGGKRTWERASAGALLRTWQEAFPDAEVDTELTEPAILEPVSPQGSPRRGDGPSRRRKGTQLSRSMLVIFAVDHLKEHLQIEVIHPDDFVMDLVDLNEKACSCRIFASCALGRRILRGISTSLSSDYQNGRIGTDSSVAQSQGRGGRSSDN